MQRLRQARFLARLVLAWFALSIGVAAAAAVLQPQGLQMVCSGGAMKVLPQDGDADGPAGPLALDCPLCATVAPPPAAHDAPVAVPLGRVVQPIPSARLAGRLPAAQTARGPPLRA